MKVKKNETGLKELFRSRLENEEITPDASVGDALMRKLARKEFVRFNPSRFNIYYAALITGAIIGAGALLFSGRKDNSADTHIVKQPETSLPAPVNIPKGKSVKLISKSADTPVKDDHSEEVPSAVQPSKVVVAEESKTIETGADKENIGLVNQPVSEEAILAGTSITKDAEKLVDNHLSSIPLFEVSAVAGCKPLKVHFHSTSEDGTYSWNFGDGGYSSKKDPDWIYDVEGEYRASLEFTGNNGSKLSHSVIIRVYPNPVAQFEISPEQAVIPDDEIRFLNYSANGITWKWEFGDGTGSEKFEPRHRYSKFGNYNVSLVAVSETGCSDTMTVVNAFSGSEYFIDMPNAFIPNTQGPTGGFYSTKSDESAEIFHPHFSGVAEYQLRIFSKIGILIFESNDVNTGWDGYFKGQLSNPGVYIWKIRGTFVNGEPFTKMGNVTLLKN
ncbi:MAG TPA: PKD domain-containing protein [Bacteroidales bacterium]|nr:PKD domain-containing protein [Bacteroidales bacterium]